MTRATPARRATDPIRVGQAATAGLPSVYRVHALALQERFQAFAAQEAVRAQLRQTTTASAVPGSDRPPLRATLITWLRRHRRQPVVGPARPDDPAVAIQA
jgi:hypothetical protein